MQILGGVQFLESHELIHGDLTCSSVLVSPEGVVKIGTPAPSLVDSLSLNRIANQERCMKASPHDRRAHPDVRALGDIMMQLMEKRKRRDEPVDANDLRCRSAMVADFVSRTMFASAQQLAAVSLNMNLKLNLL